MSSQKQKTIDVVDYKNMLIKTLVREKTNYEFIKNRLSSLTDDLTSQIGKINNELNFYCEHKWEICPNYEQEHTIYICKKCDSTRC